MVTARNKIRAEHLWWLGVVIWMGAALFWRPAPSISFASAPSANPRPSGFAVFHELVAMEAAGVRRYLGRPSSLPDDVDVLVLLSPTEPVLASHRAEMLEWVAETGGTLIVGHPFFDDGTRELVTDFSIDSDASLCVVVPWEGTINTTLNYVPSETMVSGETIAPFEAPMNAEFYPETCYGDPVLVDDGGRIFATAEQHGAGEIIQISDAGVLDNDSLGRKRAHYFAAALIGRAGRHRNWVFDEAYEGIHPSPKFVRLVGASKWRPIFLQIVLMLLIGYWQRTATFGPRLPAGGRRDMREVTTQARDIGNFYYRALKSRFALSRSLDYLKSQITIKGADPRAKAAAVALVREGEKQLATGAHDMEKHAYLARKMALAGQTLLRSSKGKVT